MDHSLLWFTKWQNTWFIVEGVTASQKLTYGVLMFYRGCSWHSFMGMLAWCTRSYRIDTQSAGLCFCLCRRWAKSESLFVAEKTKLSRKLNRLIGTDWKLLIFGFSVSHHPCTHKGYFLPSIMRVRVITSYLAVIYIFFKEKQWIWNVQRWWSPV